MAPCPGEVWAIVLAAGAASRFGEPKQFQTLGGMRLVDRVVLTATAACDAVVVVLPPGVEWDGPPVAAAVHGGTIKGDSVRAGLAAVPESAEILVIHDAAHPLASEELFRTVIEAVRQGSDGASPAVGATETLGRAEAGRLTATVPREGLLVLQTPHAFRADRYRQARALGGEWSDDATMMVALGYTVAVVPGDHRNFHVTTPEELALAERLLGGLP
jgi:2-C-methyl-D-erythritol 4-phosphate cytidylyltransferase